LQVIVSKARSKTEDPAFNEEVDEEHKFHAASKVIGMDGRKQPLEQNNATISKKRI
jgi:hypothetical protein